MWERSVETLSAPVASSRCHTDTAPPCKRHACFKAHPQRCAVLRSRYVKWQTTSCRRVLVRATPETSTPVPPPYGPGTIKEIPVFPLGIVSFPTATVPLNIFEARYRVLFNTLLNGLPGIEEDLVNDQKAWCGSRMFGMCFVNQEGGMASVGTTLYIVKHERLPDGRLLVINKGVEKFRVLRVVEERPVLVCQVEMLEDSDDASPEIAALAGETVQLFKDLIQLNVRMKRVPSMEAGVDPQIDTMTPREVSYWLGLVFSQSPMLQQALLEERSLHKRISHEREILEGTTKYLRAQVALQSAFSQDSSSSAEAETPEREPGSREPESPEGGSEGDPPPAAPASGPD